MKFADDKKSKAGAVHEAIHASNGSQTAQTTTGSEGRKDQAAPASEKGSSGQLDLLSAKRDPVVPNTCSVPEPAGCGGITADDLKRHVGSSGGYAEPDSKVPNPYVKASQDKEGRLVLDIPYYASGNRDTVRQAIRDATSEWKRVGVILNFVSSDNHEGAISIRGTMGSEYITDLRGSNGQPVACSCDAAGGIGGWVPDFKRAYITADPLSGRLERSTGPHELGGHLLGLSHRPTGIMPKQGGDARRPDGNDALRLRAIYLQGGQ
jgi:hypothetical protein